MVVGSEGGGLGVRSWRLRESVADWKEGCTQGKGAGKERCSFHCRAPCRWALIDAVRDSGTVDAVRDSATVDAVRDSDR